MRKVIAFHTMFSRKSIEKELPEDAGTDLEDEVARDDDDTHPDELLEIDSIRQIPRRGGLGRIGYLLVTFSMVTVAVLATRAVSDLPTGKSAPAAFAMSCQIMMVFPIASRIHNMGKSFLWALGWFIPVYGQFLFVLCLIAQEGYFETRKLDWAGKFAAMCYLAVFVISLWLTIMEAMHPGWCAELLLGR